MQHLKIKLDMSTAFHSQTDGSTEIANKTIIQILRNWVSTKQDNWVQHLPLVAYAINISTNDTTKMLSFYLRYGHQPIMSSFNYHQTGRFTTSSTYLLSNHIIPMMIRDFPPGNMQNLHQFLKPILRKTSMRLKRSETTKYIEGKIDIW